MAKRRILRSCEAESNRLGAWSGSRSAEVEVHGQGHALVAAERMRAARSEIGKGPCSIEDIPAVGTSHPLRQRPEIWLPNRRRAEHLCHLSDVLLVDDERRALPCGK